MLIIVGSTAGGRGISVFSQDADGSLESLGAPVETPSPTFLTAHPRLPVVFAVNTLAEGAVTALSVDGNGILTQFSNAPSGGVQPSHAAVTADGRFLICCHYGGSGVVSVLPIADDGSLRAPCHVEVPTGDRRAISHHASTCDDEVVVTFLGLGEIRGYRVGPEGSLTLGWTANADDPKAGPRHLVRHPAGPWFVSDELGSTVSVYLRDQAGDVQWSGSVPASRVEPIPGDPNRPSELALSPDGRFLYVANRGADTVAAFAVDGPRLCHLGESPTGGVRPRHFALVGSRLYVANERSAQITTLILDSRNGMPGDPRSVADVERPTCVLGLEPGLGSLDSLNTR